MLFESAEKAVLIILAPHKMEFFKGHTDLFLRMRRAIRPNHSSYQISAGLF
jgi:hypothetical protein